MHRDVLNAAHTIAPEYLDHVAARHVGGTAIHNNFNKHRNNVNCHFYVIRCITAKRIRIQSR